ncbi:DUF2871 domain-containing protein [Clostridium tertium]|jgi:hypothetical protein|uniref:DUF2871 domain-containing protein n=1 Tax=Clostridium tertium TaxID=1559 RepID=A0A9X4B3S5_9CLOT|nr:MULTISPECIES: DUF2871 domain-containing protein [Clostridium]EEH98488.1 hypothetical protein CSBG_02114 [Clostridium sp. 7_2_43FAA]MBS5307513.1 DUF2871 domain-containing protein [Clostridium sp.]MBS5885303.1 DUF2871 domain-containing protein [Clostridium sp.]MBS6502521.1 DUF2871 domain-containing protein [Clostridium sp.]MBU6137103.1 DUF2871 domain-containing protein [Clostridium tertium]
MKKYFNFATFYLVLGLVMGVFYREFTKFNGFEGKTVLSVVHTHSITLGFIFFILVLLLEKNFGLSKIKHFSKWLVLYNVSLIYVLGTFTARGIMQVLGTDFAGLSHIAGLGHAMIGIAMIWFVVIVNKSIKE